MKIRAWLSADGGNDIYAELELQDDVTEETIEREAKEAVFNMVSYGWWVIEENDDNE